MIKKGDKIHNPLSGETFTFLQTSADTEGKLLQMHVYVAPGGGQGVYPSHFHPKQEERLIIKSGWVKAVVGGKEKFYGPGETLIIPPSVSHQFWNARKGDSLEYICELRPAMQWESIFETVLVLTQLGLIREDGCPNTMQMAVILDAYPDNFGVSGVHRFIQKTLLKCISKFGKMAGYKADRDYKLEVKRERIFQAKPLELKVDKF